jgi:hypothetical protein
MYADELIKITGVSSQSKYVFYTSTQDGRQGFVIFCSDRDLVERLAILRQERE